MFKRWYQPFIVGLVAIVIASCASQPRSHYNFEEPKSMEAMVTFWENVYSKWDSTDVVFHDNVYMDVIYVEIRAHVGEQTERKLTEKKLKFLLTDMEKRIKRGETLTLTQQKYAKMLRRAGGERALVDIADRLRSQRGMKSRFKRGVEMSHAYLPYFRAVFKEAGYPEELAYLPHVESSFVNHAVSKVGASGMWQFMRSTARHFLPMENNVIDGRLDPYIASKGAVKYLKEAHDQVQSWPLALTSYNHGLGGMLRAKAQFGDDIGTIVWNFDGPRFGFASRNFYAEFLAAKRIANNPKAYFKNLTYQAVPSIEGIQLLHPMKLDELSRETGISALQLMQLNPAWLQNIKNNRAYIPAYVDVWLPKGSIRKIKSRGFYTVPKIQP